MPIYEYQCQSCEKVIEALQNLSDKPLKKCEACGGKLEKIVSRTGFILKGGGWYKDGYGAKAKGGGESKGSSTAEKGKGGGTEGSGSSTPSSKSESASTSTPAPKGGGPKGGGS